MSIIKSDVYILLDTTADVMSTDLAIGVQYCHLQADFKTWRICMSVFEST